jgi:hypothetical protein
MTNHTFQWAIALAMGAMSTATTWACTCMRLSNWEEYTQETEFVFTGKVTQKENVEPILYVFSVTDRIKGIIGTTVEITTGETLTGPVSSCAFSFQTDSIYLVFANKQDGIETLSTGLCNGSMLLGDSSSTAILAEVKEAATGLSIQPRNGFPKKNSSLSRNLNHYVLQNDGEACQIDGRKRLIIPSSSRSRL